MFLLLYYSLIYTPRQCRIHTQDRRESPFLAPLGAGQQRSTRQPQCPKYLGSAISAVMYCLTILHTQSFPCAQLGEKCSRGQRGKRRDKMEEGEGRKEEEVGVEACLKDSVIWGGEAKK